MFFKPLITTNEHMILTQSLNKRQQKGLSADKMDFDCPLEEELTKS